MHDRATAKPAAAPAAASILQRACACGNHAPGGGECAACKKKRLQRQATGAHTPNVAPPIVHDVLRAPGQPLDAGTRAFMEPRFGHDFSRVPAMMATAQRSEITVGQPDDPFEREAEHIARQVTRGAPTPQSNQPADLSHVQLHTGSLAASAARSVNAHAFTVGRHIVFNENEYQPHTQAGRELLAHELSHVLQQSGVESRVEQGLAQRSVSRGAGGCASATTEDEDNNGPKGAGRAAHTQIQTFLLPRILNEIIIPRATKNQMSSTGCQPEGVEAGRADLLRRAGIINDVGEIKPIGYARTFGVAEVEHYIRRADQSMDRLFASGPECGAMPRGTDDDDFARRLRIGRLRPTFSKLTNVLTAPTVIGPFDGDRSRTLKAELVAPGAVGYWCTGGQSDTYTCGLSEQETREYIDRVALGPAQEVLNRFLQEHIEQPLQAAMSRHSLGELLRLGERHFGTQIRQMLRPYLGPVADEVFNRATAEQLAQLIDNALGPEAQVIVTTLVRRLSSMIINELRVRLRNVLADAVRETLLALCVGAPAVSIVQLLDQLEQTLRQRARQLIPVVVTAVAAQLASMMLAELQAVLTQMAQAIGRALSALGEVLAVIGEGILRALAAIAIALVIVGALVLFVLALIALFDPAPGDEVALAAAGIFLLGLIPALGRYVATGNTAKQPEGT